MAINPNKQHAANRALWLLLLSIATFLFFFTGRVLLKDVYQFAVVGAIFEILWLPAMLLLFAIPVLCLVYFFKYGWHSLRVWLTLLISLSAFFVR